MAKISKDRVLNEELRNFVYNFVPDILNANASFVKVFGKDYVAKRIRSSILSVYTNEPDLGKTYAGYQSSIDKSITILKSGPNGALLSVGDVMADEDIQETILHESIHAILTRTPDECRKYNIDSGSGIMQTQLDDIYFQMNEMGRGLNEGLTEWFCEKAGYKSSAYPELTNFVRLLEKFVGTEKVMELGKGNILGRFPGILGMSKDEVLNLITNSDELYNVNDKLSKTRLASRVLEQHLHPYENMGDEEKARREKEFKIFEAKFGADRKSSDYLRFIAENNLDDSFDSLVEYYDKRVIKPLEKNRHIAILNFESAILSKYLTKEHEDLLNQDPLSEEAYKKLMPIFKVMNTNPEYMDSELVNAKPPYPAIDFVQKCMQKQRGHSTYRASLEAEKLKNGEFTLTEFARQNDYIRKGESGFCSKYIQDFAASVSPRFKREITDLMELATDAVDSGAGPKLLDLFSKVRLLKVRSKDPSIDYDTSIIFGKENIFNKYSYTDKKIDKDFKGEVQFDFTTEVGETGDTITAFEEFREKIFKEKPNCKIHISGRNLLIEDENDLSFFSIHKDKIVPMEIYDELDLEYQIGERVKEQEYNSALTPYKPESKIGSFINKIKRGFNSLLNRNKKVDINYGNPLGDKKDENQVSNANGSGIEVTTIKVAETPVRDEEEFVPKAVPIKPTIEKKDQVQTQEEPAKEDDYPSL